VPRSTGIRLEFPLKCASSYDLLFGCDTIEPDKVAIAAYALFRYHQVTGDSPALRAALHSAAVLAAAQGDGNSTHAPWAFRVNAADARAANGFKSGDSAFPLRLFSALVQAGYSNFAPNLSRLWAWVVQVQLQSLSAANHSSRDYGNQFVNFHEDIDAGDDSNRNSWSALELARFLIESRASGALPDWYDRVQQLVGFSLELFSHPNQIGNTTIMGEQDRDHKAWGGANSKLGAVLLMLDCAGYGAHYQMGLNNACVVPFIQCIIVTLCATHFIQCIIVTLCTGTGWLISSTRPMAAPPPPASLSTPPSRGGGGSRMRTRM
jgi:hypothetical protein